MFCRFGSVLDRRPVAVAVWLKVVCSRPSSADQLGEGVEVGRLQLRDLAPLLDRGDDLVLVADRLEHAGVGREAGLAAALARQAELLEQDRRELLRRADRELLARQLPDAALELARARVEARADLAQALDVELHARALHLHQHVHERQLDLVEQPRQAVLLEPVALALGQQRVSTARSATPSAPSHLGAEPGLGGQLVERVAAPRRDRSGRRPPSCRARAAARAGLVCHRDRLPVVGHDRPVAARQRERGERLGLATSTSSPAQAAPSSGPSDRRRSRGSLEPPAGPRARPPPPPPRARVLLDGELLVGVGGGGAGSSGPRRRAARPPPPARPRATRARRAEPRAPHRDDLLDALGRRRAVLAERLLQPLERRAQLELAERLAQARAVRARGPRGRSRSIVDVDVAHGAASCFEMRASSACSVRFSLRLAPGDRVDVREHPLEVAPLLEQLRGGLLADARDARGCCPRCRPSGPRSRGPAPAGCRSGRSRPRGRRPWCR